MLVLLLLLAVNGRAAAASGFIRMRKTWEWMKENVPVLAVPDRELQLTYYCRWWFHRKHIAMTPAGYVLAEFLRPMRQSGDYRAIGCAGGAAYRRRALVQFSNWTADALYDPWLPTAALSAWWRNSIRYARIIAPGLLRQD